MQELRAIPGVGAVLDALAAYTERHLARMDRLRRSVALLDYTLGCMHVIEETALKVCSSSVRSVPCSVSPLYCLIEPRPMSIFVPSRLDIYMPGHQPVHASQGTV